jgi:hypothetical protein
MTRGTLYFIEKLKEKIRVTETCEFNGDMYRESEGGYGGEVMRLLEKSKNRKEFIEEVKQFDKENFDYQSEGNPYFGFRNHFIKQDGDYPITRQGNLIIVDFEADYFKWFFSDWTFWKNNTKDCEVHFMTRDRNLIKLKPGEVVAINFGYKKNHYFGELGGII